MKQIILILMLTIVLLPSCKKDSGDNQTVTSEVVVIENAIINTPTTWYSNKKYLLKGFNYVDRTTLTIQPGTIIKGDEGSCFDCVMKLLNVSFPEALEIINRDHCLNLEATFKTVPPPKQTAPEQSKPNFSIKKRQFNEAEIAFWNKYNISTEILQRYNVAALEEFSNVSK